MKIHASQLVETINAKGKVVGYMEADGDKGRIEIEVAVSKSKMFMIPVKATEFWIDENEQEGENDVELAEACQALMTYIPADCEHGKVEGKTVWSAYYNNTLYPLLIPVGDGYGFAYFG